MAYRKIISKVDEVIGRVNTHPEYSACITREKYHALREGAKKHSLDIELESELRSDPRILTANERKFYLKTLDNADRFLSNNGVNHYTLSKLGHMISPRNHPYDGFRRIGGVLVHSSSDSFEVPDSKDIYPRIMNLIGFLRDSPFHPIVRAANAHLEMVVVHPYEDGNKRSARLLQNFCLQERGYPPAVILVNERRNYLDRLWKVWRSRLDKKSSMHNPSFIEEEFYEFIASKVLDSAMQVEEELKNRRIYDVILKNYENFGIVRSVAAALRASGKIENKGVSVSMDKRNGGKKGSVLRITGDMSQDELRQKLEKFAKRYNFNFQTGVNLKSSC